MKKIINLLKEKRIVILAIASIILLTGIGIILYNHFTLENKNEIEIKVEKSKYVLQPGYTDVIVLSTNGDSKQLVFTYESSDTSIVTVDDKGQITALKEGTATIIIKDKNNKIIQKCEIVVIAESTEEYKIELDTDTDTIKEKDKIKLNPRVMPDENLIKAIEYSSSKEEIATVDGKGIVTALKEGETTITLKISDLNIELKHKIIVEKLVVEKIEILPDTLTIKENDTVKLTIALEPNTIDNEVMTYESSDEKVAKVDKDGNVHAIKEGDCIIKVTTSNGKNATAQIKVLKKVIPVTEITASLEKNTVNPGEKTKVLTTILPDNATNKTIKYSSADTSIATVNDEGEITALKPGKTNIIVAASSGISKTIIITVNQVAIEDISIDKTNVSLNIGKTETINVNVTPSNATNKKITYKSNNSNIATVDDKGLIRAVKEGTTSIVITASSGISKIVNVTVTAQVLNVLFIGNSKTYYNNFPAMFERLTNNAYEKEMITKKVHVEQFSFGSYGDSGLLPYTGFTTSARDLRTLSYRRTESLFTKIASKKWDYIVLQGSSNFSSSTNAAVEQASQAIATIIAYVRNGKESAINTDSSYKEKVKNELLNGKVPAIRSRIVVDENGNDIIYNNSADSIMPGEVFLYEFNEKIKGYINENYNRNQNVKVIVDSVQGTREEYSSSSVQNIINSNWEKVRTSVINSGTISSQNIKVAYTGNGYVSYKFNYNNANIDDLFYDTTKNQQHANVAGSYLRACVNFATIFGVSPVGIDYDGAISNATDSLVNSSTGKIQANTPTKYCDNPNHQGIDSSMKQMLQTISFSVQNSSMSFNDK